MRSEILLGWILAVAATGCGGDDAPWVHEIHDDKNDVYALGKEWLRRCPGPLEHYPPYCSVCPSFTVSELMQSEARSRLISRDWQRLSTEEANRFVGRALPDNGTVAALLRCVKPLMETSYDRESDNLKVSWKDRSVLVYHGSRRDTSMRLYGDAIIALLPQEPTEVYVEQFTPNVVPAK